LHLDAATTMALITGWIWVRLAEVEAPRPAATDGSGGEEIDEDRLGSSRGR